MAYVFHKTLPLLKSWLVTAYLKQYFQSSEEVSQELNK